MKVTEVRAVMICVDMKDPIVKNRHPFFQDEIKYRCSNKCSGAKVLVIAIGHKPMSEDPAGSSDVASETQSMMDSRRISFMKSVCMAQKIGLVILELRKNGRSIFFCSSSSPAKMAKAFFEDPDVPASP